MAIKYNSNTVNEMEYNTSPVKKVMYNSTVAYIRKVRENIYRWVVDGTVCDGYDEHQKLVKQVSIDGGDGTLHNYSTPDTDYLVKYELINDTTITDIFSGNLGGGWGSDAQNIDFLIPSQVTEIQSLPMNVGNVVIEAATPPTISVEWSDFVGDIYVPDNAVSVYETAWGDVSSRINPISEYQGNLPV